MEALKYQSNNLITLSQTSNKIEPLYQLVNVPKIRKGDVCLIQSHICVVFEICFTKPGRQGICKYMMKGKDIFLGNCYSQIFRGHYRTPKFTIKKISYLLLQDSNENGLLSGFRSDGQGQVFQTSLDIQLQEPKSVNSIFFEEKQFKVQNYAQLPVSQKIQRTLFMESSQQFLKKQRKEGFHDVEFKVMKCFGYCAIIEFSHKQKLIKLDDFYQILEKQKQVSSNSIQKQYPVNSQKQKQVDVMALTIQNLLNQELISLKINQEKKKCQNSHKQIGIQSDSHLRQNQIKLANIQKLTIECDQIQLFQRTIQKKETQQIYRHFLCPISSQLMKKPVILTSCGHTFDKQMITKWIRQRNQACPICIKKTTLKDIVPNFVLTDLIATFLEVAKSQKLNQSI